MKTYQEFISEAKKCWPGYKKKGTQKLFGKIYNRCVKESEMENFEYSEEFKQMPGQLMNKQMLKLQKSQSDLRKGRQTEKKRNREIKYDMQMKAIQMAGKQDYNRSGESYGKFYQDPLKTGKIRNPRFR